jgi:hypothetical protein
MLNAKFLWVLSASVPDPVRFAAVKNTVDRNARMLIND